MPGTAHGVADDRAFGERPAVVRAGRADREELVADAREQHRLAVRVPEQLAARLSSAAAMPAARSGPVSAVSVPPIYAVPSFVWISFARSRCFWMIGAAFVISAFSSAFCACESAFVAMSITA